MIEFVYIETYGCAANQNNSEIMKSLISQAGLDFTDNPKIADIIILNTCIVKGPTENSLRRRIQDLSKLNKPIILAGCMPEVRKIKQKNIFCLGLSHVKDIAKLIRKISERNYSEKEFMQKRKEIKLGRKIRNNKLVGITQISEGCLGNCKFCITRHAKGYLFSYPEDDIVKNIKEDLASGCKEVWITSQDNASYGLDCETTLINVLKKAVSIPRDFKIRIGMMNPNHTLLILDELIDIYKDEKVYKFLHLPVQSGSDKILKSMGRKYTSSEFLKIIEKFRKEFPDITIATDVILGYPGETDKDYKETLKLIEKARPDIMNISKFWPMKGTEAAEMKQISPGIAKRRAAETQRLHLKISQENNQKYVGKTVQVLVAEQTGSNCISRTKDYRIVILKSDKNILGRKLEVKIKKAFPHYLIGEVSL